MHLSSNVHRHKRGGRFKQISFWFYGMQIVRQPTVVLSHPAQFGKQDNSCRHVDSKGDALPGMQPVEGAAEVWDAVHDPAGDVSEFGRIVG